MTITEPHLVAIMTRIDVERWRRPLNESMALFSIVTPERAAAFLAQIAHESDECRRVVENLKYSAAGLCKTWPTRFPTLEAAQPYAGNQEAIANKVYSGRLGNGDEASGDGWRYRGRGILQITGRSNYRAAGAALSMELERYPEQLEQPAPAALAAAQFWDSRGCNALADRNAGDDDDADFVRITLIINGGKNGLKERRAYWARAIQALTT